jgi:aminoglycoside phosphotransferase (APT) family kinase protein
LARTWDADVDVTAALAARLIDAQFPEFRPARVEAFSIGWDNAAFTVNDDWIFRLPRRKIANECMTHELRWLPAIAAALPVRISAPERAGKPAEGYPYGFSGYRRLEGETGCRVDVRDPVPLAGDVAAFLKRLHAIPAPEDAVGDLIRRTDLPFRVEKLKDTLARLDAARFEPVRSKLESLKSTPPWPGPRRWLHGDLYGRHLLVAADGRLAGVIDWGDLHAGDPALDLSIAFSYFRGAARDALLASYGPVDAATLDRARFKALTYGIILSDYGVEVGDAPMRRLGERAVDCGLA